MCPGYDIKPSDGKALIIGLWKMQSTPSLPLLSVLPLFFYKDGFGII